MGDTSTHDKWLFLPIAILVFGEVWTSTYSWIFWARPVACPEAPVDPISPSKERMPGDKSHTKHLDSLVNFFAAQKPLKIDMEPTNYPVREENDLPKPP